MYGCSINKLSKFGGSLLGINKQHLRVASETSLAGLPSIVVLSFFVVDAEAGDNFTGPISLTGATT